MNRLSRFLTIACLALSLALPVAALGDYGFLWWAHGWRGTSPEGARVLCVQTNRYGLALDVNTLALGHFGPIQQPKSYAEAVSDANDVVFDHAPAKLALWVEWDGDRYTSVRAAHDTQDQANYPVRLIESGQVVQRFDIQQLVFQGPSGDTLQADGRLEVVAWPDRAHVVLSITPKRDMGSLQAGLSFGQGAEAREEVREAAQRTAGETLEVHLSITPDATTLEAQPAPVIAVSDPRSGGAVPVTWDAPRGWHYVDLPEATWDIGAEPDRLDRFPLHITNPGEEPMAVPLNFAFDGSFSGVIGMTPMLLDAQGHPTGIPVQVSKNWHRLPDRRLLYEGPWFHGFSQIEVAPGETWTGELAIAYAFWGGVPAVSHAQLSLVGWGVNQRWDQVAIGSWGEMICYDPDVNLNRSMIDDMRPLMVNGMNDNGKWGWTVNVGGGDFLVYFDSAGKKHYLSRMRAAYLEPGPNLTRAVYAGTTPDGALDARIEVSSPRCDDVNRSFHTIRYDVRKPMAFSRLAFYQVGADNYNDHQFTAIARGNADGLIEEWPVEQGGKVYHRTDMACAGEVPWFSLHGGERNDHHPKGAWANRGLVIRSWKARLGGVDVPQPTAAIYGTENGMPSAALELVPPPGCTKLLPGDFVEADLELVVLPAEAGTYYGPNAAFKDHLEANINTWKPVHRLATMNHGQLEVTKGKLERGYPIEIAVDAGGEAVLSLYRMAGYVPVTFTGLTRWDGYRLNGISPEAEQFVQVAYDDESGTWSRTYNINSDTLEKGLLSLQRLKE